MLEKLNLNKERDKHLYLQLYNQLKSLIKKKELKPHTKLPAIRKLSNQLDINNVTVVKAYDLLAEENLVYKKIGSGTFVQPQFEFKDRTSFQLDEKVYIDEEAKFESDEEVINFATSAPDPDLYPIKPFKKLLNKVLERDRGYAFGYQSSQGYSALRESLAEYSSQQQIEATAENIQIVSGAQQGINILAQTLLEEDDVVLTESPSYPGASSVFTSYGAQVAGVPLESDGLNIEVLEKKIKTKQPKFLYLMSRFQNPTGYSYSPAKIETILNLAETHDLLIIEDDFLGDLNYFKPVKPTFKQFDDQNRVIYIKSFSKVLMPGLRLAYLIIPAAYQEQILLSKYMSDIFTDGLIQRVVDLYFREGLWHEQINNLLSAYKKRYEQMITALDTYLPQAIDYIEPEGGLNVWLKLPESIKEKRLYDQALGAGLKIVPGHYFYSQESRKNRIRLSIAAVNSLQIKEGIKRLTPLIKNLAP